MTLYFAYGSNLNKRQMRVRCPKARPIGAYHLRDARLVFRIVADVIYAEGEKVYGAIWKITPECEQALDRYEGYRPTDPENSMYRKVYLELDTPIEGETVLMLYVMNSEGIAPPSQIYLDGIREGYRDFGINTKPLMDAVEASYENRNPSHVERQRYRRNGRPQLAERPSLRKKAKKKNGQQQIDFDLRRNAMCVYGD
jgi:gamma-glutamylcyclotransferase (GGCT)/AIG2-like uncharacterized protein YtfP